MLLLLFGRRLTFENVLAFPTQKIGAGCAPLLYIFSGESLEPLRWNADCRLAQDCIADCHASILLHCPVTFNEKSLCPPSQKVVDYI
jgi:hypothetical protein